MDEHDRPVEFQDEKTLQLNWTTTENSMGKVIQSQYLFDQTDSVRELLAKGYPAAAWNTSMKVLEDCYKDPEILLVMGMVADYIGNCEGAIGLFCDAFFLAPDDDEIIEKMVETGRKIGSISEFKPMVNECRRINPENRMLKKLSREVDISNHYGSLPPYVSKKISNTWNFYHRFKNLRESALAHRYLDGLTGIEIGGAAYNGFGLKTRNIDFTTEWTIYKREDIRFCGESQKVDVVANGAIIPFKDSCLDFIVHSHVLEHIQNPIKALKDWYRAIRNEGYLFMIVPHKERTFDKNRKRTPLKELIHRYEIDYSSDYYGHQNFWITQDVVELISYLGWGIIDVQNFDDKLGNGFTVVVKVGK